MATSTQGLAEVRLHQLGQGTDNSARLHCCTVSTRIVSAPRELALHLVLAERPAQEPVQDAAHPAEAGAVAQQLHQERRRRQERHAGDEALGADGVVQERKEDAEARVGQLASPPYSSYSSASSLLQPPSSLSSSYSFSPFCRL